MPCRLSASRHVHAVYASRERVDFANKHLRSSRISHATNAPPTATGSPTAIRPAYPVRAARQPITRLSSLLRTAILLSGPPHSTASSPGVFWNSQKGAPLHSRARGGRTP
jgi:hypothetical protein